MRRALVGLVGVALATTAILLLRSELMTVDVPQPDGSSTVVVVRADTVRERPGVVEEMTRGLVSTCRLLVNADVAEDSFRSTGRDEFTFRLRPGLDEFDRRELRGCLSDLRVQHLLLDVLRLETTVPRAGAPTGGS